jgi:hypothetical protein
LQWTSWPRRGACVQVRDYLNSGCSSSLEVVEPHGLERLSTRKVNCKNERVVLRCGSAAHFVGLLFCNFRL